MHRCQYHKRIELLNHHLRTAVGETVHRGQHHTEAMEQRYAYAQLVFLCECHVLACDETIVGDVVMREHHTLREARRATRVLHVYHIVASHLALHLRQHLVVDVLTQQQQLSGVEHAAMLLHADVHHVLHIREALAHQVAALAVAQLRQHFVRHVHVVALPRTVGDTQRMHVGILAEELQLRLFVVRVHRHQHRSNFRRSIKERQPVRHVRSPNAYVRALLHTDGEQAFRKVVDTFVERGPRESQVTVAIHNIFPVGRHRCPVFKPLTQCALI